MKIHNIDRPKMIVTKEVSNKITTPHIPETFISTPIPKSQKIWRIPLSIWYENPKQIIIKKNLLIFSDKKLINDWYANSPINKQPNQIIIRGKSNTKKNPDILWEIERTEVN